jgi:hypothetical protein
MTNIVNSQVDVYLVHNNIAVFFSFVKFAVEIGVEGSIVDAPPHYNFDQQFTSNLTFWVFLMCSSLKNQSFLRRLVHQLFKSNLTFCVICNLQFENSVFLRRMVHSQSTLQRQLRRQI